MKIIYTCVCVFEFICVLFEFELNTNIELEWIVR